MTHRDDSLIGQILAANVLLVALTLLAASLAAGLDLTARDQRWSFMVLALSIVLTLCVNLWMLQRRFRPLERLIERVERIDPAQPLPHALTEPEPVAEIGRLSSSFRRLLESIEEERRRSGTLVLRAQEDERGRLARDLHDEVSQALTGILMGLDALGRSPEVAELERLVSQARDGLLSLAHQLRPSALDHHGLVTALEALRKGFAAHTCVETRLHVQGDTDALAEDVQTAVYRVTQEALANVTRHAAATVVEIDVEVEDRRVALRVRDDGRGFDPGAVTRGGRLGLTGMAERARLAGGALDVRSAPGGGTTVSLLI